MTTVTGLRPPIKALIFDMGGILEPPFDDVLVPALVELLGISAARLLEHRATAAAELSEGRLTLRDFYTRVLGEAGGSAGPAEAVVRHLAVYEAATAQFDGRVLALIRWLRRRHVVACLTNTEVEVGRFNRERGLYTPFDRAFLSTEMGLSKPGRAIFERAVAELQCAPAEALFTDDKLENTVGARAAGLHAIHYRDFETFSEELARLIELDQGR